MSYEGVRDWFGIECKSLINFREGKWEFGGLDIPGLQGFEVNIGKISSESKNLQKISDLILALDNLQFNDCQKRKKWHERLKKENDPAIRLEITRRLLDSEDKSYQNVLEIVRLLKETKSIIDDPKESSNDIEFRLEEVLSR